MTYEEAIEYSLTVRWKVACCLEGPDCWCRMIVPQYTISFDGEPQKEGLYIIGAGKIPKEYADYIVNLHNQSLQSL